LKALCFYILITIHLIAFGQDVQHNPPVLYYEYEVQVKDTFYLKSANTWLPLNNSHEKVFKCYVGDDWLMYVEYMVSRDIESGKIYHLIPTKDKSGDTIQFYYFPKQIYKHGEEFYKAEPSFSITHQRSFLTAMQTVFEHHDTIPSSVVFPPYAWLGGGFGKISDVYLHARLTKIAHQPIAWKKELIENVISQFYAFPETEVNIRKYVIETAARQRCQK
jgi:hypothetical protein